MEHHFERSTQLAIWSALEKMGKKGPILHITPLSGGANNQVYRLELPASDPIICKRYFRHPQDQTERLKAEFGFLTYAQSVQIANVPKPLAYDEKENLAFYSYLPGDKITKARSKNIDHALRFFLQLNKNKQKGQRLPFAAERCLRSSDFFLAVEKKMGRFATIEGSGKSPQKVAAFIQNQLLPAWEKIKEKRKSPKTELKIDLVAKKDLCITPSDFGFHNALWLKNATYFFDFEYAGWDDPTKTVCDFFCQPKVEVPQSHFDKVAETIAKTTSDPTAYLERIHFFYPICRIKWCFMLLTVFQKIGRLRRNFSNPNLLEKSRYQLELAEAYLQKTLDGLY